MNIVLDLQTLPTDEGGARHDLADGGPHLQSDAGSLSCATCSWVVGCAG